MSIPPLIDIGEPGQLFLAPGVYECTLDEIEERFAINPRRKRLMQGCRDYLGHWKRWIDILAAYINGSFISNKDKPRDVDIIVVIKDEDVEKPDTIRLLNTYTRKKYEYTYFRCHGFGMPKSLDGNYIVLSQMQLTFPSGREKGILRVSL
jgi:hypothetical protein